MLYVLYGMYNMIHTYVYMYVCIHNEQIMAFKDIKVLIPRTCECS